jgi:solute carrier family 36 (proton-coupled amino acid transporter)
LLLSSHQLKMESKSSSTHEAVVSKKPSNESTKTTATMRSKNAQLYVIINHLPTTYIKTLMRMLKGNVGTGCFAMAEAMKNSGMILGPILIIIIATISVHTQQMLIKYADIMQDRYQLQLRPDYADTVKLCFFNSKCAKWRKWGLPMKRVCNVFICITQFGFCCVALLFVGEHLRNVLYYHEVLFFDHVWLFFALILVWLTVLVRTLKYVGELN